MKKIIRLDREQFIQELRYRNVKEEDILKVLDDFRNSSDIILI